MPAPDAILNLIQRYDEQKDAYSSPAYHETQVQREFIDPFFKALGWDVDNEKGFAEQWKEVVHEDAIKVGGATKAPDYSFRLGGRRLFFLEAKKPAINLKDDPSPAYQLRRYAWTAKMPLSILTNFEEFIVFDTRVRPAPTDKASFARTIYIRYEEYAERWEEIASLFSPEAIQRGAFDRYVQSTTKKRGTAEVDDAFLAEIEEWRQTLAKNIALRNPELNQRELNFSVQRIIDRIVFLRICEDRGVEEYGQLQALLNGENVYKRLYHLFEKADGRYNSGLFHFHEEKGRASKPDSLTPTLIIDDPLIKEILRRLYYPDSPYEFSVMPAEILGQVYERFLGSVIRLTKGHRAVVELKPEVRKAGGVFYTPVYIVDYIVQQTIGKFLEGKTPQEIAGATPNWKPAKGKRPLAIVDPACGSGSFLLGVYQYLLDWHLEQYLADPKKWSRGRRPRIFQDRRGAWQLTTAERKRILLANIHGVDIDSQAVEVTKLSLLLKVLEDESAETLEQHLEHFHERALPDLGANVKCGNSLIGFDFYDNGQTSMFGENEEHRINVFDWDEEFPGIMKSGGFDAVIGNPPYVRIQAMKEWAPNTVDYYKRRYRAARSGNYDIYVIFIEKGLQLLGENGRLGFICPHKFFNAKYGEGVRSVVAEGRHLSHVVHFGDQQVFPGATTYTCLLFLDKAGVDECRYHKVGDLTEWRENNSVSQGGILANQITSAEWNFSVGNGAALIQRLHKIETKLGHISDIFVGLQTSADEIYIVPVNANIEDGLTKPLLLTGELAAYATPTSSARLIFPYEVSDDKAKLYPQDVMMAAYPKGWEYLNKHRQELRNRERGKWRHKQWYAFGRSQNLTQMDGEKLIIQVTAQKPTVLYDVTGLYMTGGGSGPFYGIRSTESTISNIFLLGVLNSALFGWIVKAQSTNLRGGYIKFSKQYIESVPIIVPGKAAHDRMVTLVERMLDLQKKIDTATTDHTKTIIQRQINYTDKQIDRLVYELYELTDQEIAIVEAHGSK